MAAEQAQAKVEASVFAITTAFTSGLDVFRKLRERRARRKKTRKAHGRRSHAIAAQEHVSDDESQLAKSLQRGPVEIQDRYELNRSHAGERFARGDATAHASLTEVLLKLNTGLVAIISSFLCHGKNDSNLDYKSLAHLSDCSRSEAIDALDQLYQRLSQSQVNLDSGRTCCPNCRSQKHADCGSVVDLQSTREQKPVAKKQSLVAVKPAPNGATPLPPTKSPKPRGSQSRLVMVRPRKSRLKPSSSTSAMQSSKPLATMPPRSRSPDGTAATQRAAPPPPPPPPPPKLHKLPRNRMLRSMTSLAAEPIPEHALPSSPPLPPSLLPPPYPGPPASTSYHAYNRSTSALRRTASSVENARTNANAAPPKPPKIPLSPREQRNGPTSNLLPYSPYPATQHAAAAAAAASSSSSALSAMPATTRRSHSHSHSHSHSRLRPPPPRHSSMPPIPLATPPPPQNPQPRLLSDDNTPSLHQQQPPPPPPPPRHRRTTVPHEARRDTHGTLGGRAVGCRARGAFER
ncbi:hypothetical protein IWZ03DRAFT_404697 [Phyllosticta citriasiana]|uniref:Uncharacterized protein n=1 Tax=Phyllosticta citriasiana TaxID=595635 RepID=A0ABR1KS75_9PEZI